MRVIAGALGGRNFASPKGHRTHPMSDRVRGGLFNALGELDGLTVLDAFAGSGALGFEAASRGAHKVVSIDDDRSACAAMKAATRELGLASVCKVVQASVQAWSRTAPVEDTYDVVLCDPPYDDTQLPVVSGLISRLNQGGVLVLSWPGGADIPQLTGLELVRDKSYGDAQLAFYRRSV